MEQTIVLGNISPLIPAGKDFKKTITFYQEKLGFTVIHKEGNPLRMAIIKRDAAQIFLVQEDYQQIPEGIAFRIQVTNIERLYQEIISKEQNNILPNHQLAMKPWGVQEFTIIAPAEVCITFYQ